MVKNHLKRNKDSDRESGALYIKLRKFHMIREESLPYFTTFSHSHKEKNKYVKIYKDKKEQRMHRN